MGAQALDFASVVLVPAVGDARLPAVGLVVPARELMGQCGVWGYRYIEWQGDGRLHIGADLHLETRWVGFGALPLEFWGGRLPAAEISRTYADPLTLFGLAPAWNGLVERLEACVWRVVGGGRAAEVDVAAMLADWNYNVALKMALEACLGD